MFGGKLDPDIINMYNVYKTTFAKCEKGNNRTMLDWWLLNGEKIDKSTLDNLECFEPTEVDASLQRMLDISNNMLGILKEDEK